MKTKQHMSFYGVGPIYVFIIISLSLLSIFISTTKYFSAGTFNILRLPLMIIGILLIILGIFLWVQAVIVAKIAKSITENKLLTTGAYAWVRNPIYSAVSFILTGVLCMQNNLFLLVMPLCFWLILSIIVRKEEVILEKTFGQEYLDYKAKVNRCIPWFPKK